jgi:cytochrome c-type biogenesis protein CcmH/NrfG
LGSAYLDSGRLASAIRAYRKAIRFTPLVANLWVGLGQTYLIQDRVEAARSIFKKATKICPQDINTWINLGHAYHKEKRFSDAIIAYQQAIRLDPQNSLAISSLVACYRLVGKDDLVEELRRHAQT